MNNLQILDKIVGCMYGGAIGDALGYPVEFHSHDGIVSHYGENGITDFELSPSGIAEISDDTQMTLFTANGLLNCEVNVNDPSHIEVDVWTQFIGEAYKAWLDTQTKPYSSRKGNFERSQCWVYDREELWNLRAPGNTCMSSLRKKSLGSIADRINTSKGCGGVMRVAPVGIVLPKYTSDYEYIFNVGAEAAALTHGHIDGWAPAGLLAVLIAKLIYTNDSLDEILKSSMRLTREICEKYDADSTLLINKVNRAYNLAINSTGSSDDVQNISILGGGWTGEEALAIAIYCTVKYSAYFQKAITTAVNHGGDSDSTGAITGNLVGAMMGDIVIPRKYKENLECSDIIERISIDMFTDTKALNQLYHK